MKPLKWIVTVMKKLSGYGVWWGRNVSFAYAIDLPFPLRLWAVRHAQFNKGMAPSFEEHIRCLMATGSTARQARESLILSAAHFLGPLPLPLTFTMPLPTPLLFPLPLHLPIAMPYPLPLSLHLSLRCC
jgi:hypothetical protein